MTRLRLMACADLHGSTRSAISVAKKAKQAEVHAVVCAGDFSNFGAVWEDALAPLVLAERKLLCVPGNHEPPELMAQVVETFPWIIDLDRAGLRMGAFALLGFGAAGLDKPGWDPDPGLAELKALAAEAQQAVLVTHVPPQTAGDTEKRLWAWCEEVQPAQVICGHYHRRAGQRFSIGQTRVACVGRRGQLVEVG